MMVKVILQMFFDLRANTVRNDTVKPKALFAKITRSTGSTMKVVEILFQISMDCNQVDITCLEALVTHGHVILMKQMLSVLGGKF